MSWFLVSCCFLLPICFLGFVLVLAAAVVWISISVTGFLAAADALAMSCVPDGRSFLRQILASSFSFLLKPVFERHSRYWLVAVGKFPASQSEFARVRYILGSVLAHFPLWAPSVFRRGAIFMLRFPSRCASSMRMSNLPCALYVLLLYGGAISFCFPKVSLWM